MNPTTDTPRTDACPHCGAKPWDSGDTGYKCGSDYIQEETETPIIYRSLFCYGNENSQLKRELAASKAEVERLRGLLNAHAEFLIKNGFYRESRDLMGGSWSDGFVALAKKCGINPYDQ